MRATKVDLRLHDWLQAAIYCLGFWAPWERYTGLSFGGSTVWTAAPAALSRSHLADFSVGAHLLLVAATIAAILSVLLQLWSVVSRERAFRRPQNNPENRRSPHLRALGVSCQAIALAVLMPPSGAGVALLLTILLQLYLASAATAPRSGSPAHLEVDPNLPPIASPRAGRSQTTWLRGAASAIFPLATALGFLAQGSSYNGTLILRWVLVGFGLQLILDALSPDTARLRA